MVIDSLIDDAVDKLDMGPVESLFVPEEGLDEGFYAVPSYAPDHTNGMPGSGVYIGNTLNGEYLLR